MAAIGDYWLTTLGWMAGLAVGFAVLVRLMPCNPGIYWWKDLRAVATDFLYWFVVPLFLRLCRVLMLVGGTILLFNGGEPDLLPVKDVPLWQQCLAILLIQDVMLYWIHRFFHGRLAWKFHAIHHSPKVLDWMSTARFHPINNLLSFGLADVTVLLLGFAPAALVALAPFNIIYSAMVHANLSWTFGPLRFVFASPVFHRWHHTTQEEGLDKNFASTFSFLDLMFGTYHMPRGKVPEHFGTGEPDFPEGLWDQLVHPFRRSPGPGAIAVPSSEKTGAEERPRRPAGTAIKVASVLVVVNLIGGGAYLAARRAQRTAEVPEEQVAVMARMRAEAARHARQLDLVRGTAVLSVVVTGDGNWAVSGNEDGTVKVWDAGTGKEVRTLKGHARAVRGVAISADGRSLVSGSYDKTVKVWDALSGGTKFTLTGHTSFVLSVAVSADGQRIVSGSADGTVRVWDGRTGQEQRVLPRDMSAVPSVAISADGRRIVSASWGTVKVWDGETGREEHVLKGHSNLVYSVAISPDGERIISGSFDETVKVWDAGTGKEALTLKGHTGPVYSVAISPNGQTIVSGSKDQTVKVWDARTGQEKLSLTGHKAPVTCVAMSADGKRIVSGSQDGTIKACEADKAGPDRRTAQRGGRE
jgi:sterol desaturase/sphingolipid hydroxylase (fatty acid hydroxylase superfamily)